VIEIKLNGQKICVEGQLSINGLILSLKLDASRIVVQLNGEMIGQDKYDDQRIDNGDEIELLKFMAGG
jgi:thiamine biosynthesis protein ThiS